MDSHTEQVVFVKWCVNVCMFS